MDDEARDPSIVSVTAYLDDAAEPFATYRPPGRFRLDTTTLDDGEHVVRIRAADALGNIGQRRIPFVVRNGPGITISGLRAGTTVHGVLDVDVNAFGGEEPFDPVRAESHDPIPVWTWIVCGLVAAWAFWYGLEFFKVPADFATTPTYAANPAIAAAGEAASGNGAHDAPKFTGKGAAGGFDFEATGQAAYTANCASCHGAEGAGVPSAFPMLAGDPVVSAADPSKHIGIILRGLHGSTIAGKSYSGTMPSFAALSDQDIAAIVDHERTSWGNRAPIITPSDVTKIRHLP